MVESCSHFCNLSGHIFSAYAMLKTDFGTFDIITDLASSLSRFGIHVRIFRFFNFGFDGNSRFKNGHSCSSFLVLLSVYFAFKSKYYMTFWLL